MKFIKLACVVAPALNEADADEIPEHLRRDLEFRFVAEIMEVLEIALEPPGGAPRRRRRPQAARRV